MFFLISENFCYSKFAKSSLDGCIIPLYLNKLIFSDYNRKNGNNPDKAYTFIIVTLQHYGRKKIDLSSKHIRLVQKAST